MKISEKNYLRNEMTFIKYKCKKNVLIMSYAFRMNNILVG